MPQSAWPMSDQTNFSMEKENNPHPGTGTQRQPSTHQRQPTEKVANTHMYQLILGHMKTTMSSSAGAEEAAIAECHEAAKARKVKRARLAKENTDEEGNDQQKEEAESVASPTVSLLVINQFERSS